jgi:hypothetical protein
VYDFWVPRFAPSALSSAERKRKSLKQHLSVSAAPPQLRLEYAIVSASPSGGSAIALLAVASADCKFDRHRRVRWKWKNGPSFTGFVVLLTFTNVCQMIAAIRFRGARSYVLSKLRSCIGEWRSILFQLWDTDRKA